MLIASHEAKATAYKDLELARTELIFVFIKRMVKILSARNAESRV